MTVILTGRDVIVNTKTIGAYLTGSDDWILDTADWEDGVWKCNGLGVLWFQDMDHGQVLSGKGTRSR